MKLSVKKCICKNYITEDFGKLEKANCQETIVEPGVGLERLPGAEKQEFALRSLCVMKALLYFRETDGYTNAAWVQV